MQAQQFIAVEACCEYYNVDADFIYALHEYGLIEMNTIEEKKVINDEDLQELEKFIHLHYDLNINMEGLDVIRHMLNRIKDLQREILSLRNKMQRFE
ncbi:MAG: chaperone modulator CbpM [Bacteroidetes bacterium]|nr:chaperone modulator CbpM [Bacteroidota bacterium]